MRDVIVNGLCILHPTNLVSAVAHIETKEADVAVYAESIGSMVKLTQVTLQEGPSHLLFMIKHIIGIPLNLIIEFPNESNLKIEETQIIPVNIPFWNILDDHIANNVEKFCELWFN